ncbi:MAG: sugar transferase [Oscillospiraceae bacterium]|nr:sugar transferase [Oscillospiraceae bacterium]
MRAWKQDIRLLLVSDEPYPAAWAGAAVCGRAGTDTPDSELRRRLQGCDGLLLYHVPSVQRSRMIRLCCREQRCICIVPEPEEILLRSARMPPGMPFWVCSPGLSPLQKAAKRAFDLLCGTTALLLSAPLMLLCAAAVKLCDGGSILYRQERLTEGGKVFTCLKFRSMIPDAEPDGARLAVPDDARVTPVGAVLRRFRLDELPQLFNILRGDMSVVGPRPERPCFAEQYAAQEPAFRLRLLVKAGLTGLAQVCGRYDTPPAEKLRMDLTYITGYSFLKDVEIILLTAKALLLPPHGWQEQPKEDPT